MAEQKQYNMESVVGNKVLIQLHSAAYQSLDIQGIESERFVAKVVGADGFGLWIENPRYCTMPVFDDNGEYIPPEKRGEVCYRAIVLIQWGFIQTILQFPEREAFFGGMNEPEIGFKRHALALAEAPEAGPTGIRRVVTVKSGGENSKPKARGKAGGKARG